MTFFTDEADRASEQARRPQASDGRRRVYITQFNTPSLRNLAPLAAGLLYSNAMNDPRLAANYNIQIEILRDHPEKIAASYESPVILAYSVYFWNFQQSVETAKAAKARHPNTLILFGGPSVPLEEYDMHPFFEKHPYIDVVVPGEGEIIFNEILTALLDGQSLEELDGVSLRKPDGSVIYKKKRPAIKDVSNLPSPFLNGTFDQLFERYGEKITGVVWETNRGCPFTCTFCYWGGPESKISQFPMERIQAELEWIARNKISYVFGADANFGILKRDVEIARHMAALNKETGYPKYFVINWTKNATEKIFEIVDALSVSDVKFMMTTSIQSHNLETLKAIKRQNIKLESFQRILEEASKRNFHTYSELILGLPFETYKSFVEGVGKVMVANIFYHFNIYCCVLIPGTEMAEPDYRQQYQLETRRCVMNLGKTIHLGDSLPEYEDLVVSTSTMSIEDWKRSHRFAFFAKGLYGFRLTFFLFNYLRKQFGVDLVELLEFIIDRSLAQPEDFPRMRYTLSLLEDLEEAILAEGNETIRIAGLETSLHPEVAVLVGALSQKKDFYQELDQLIRAFFADRALSLDEAEYIAILCYQYAIIPSWNESNLVEIDFPASSFAENSLIETKDKGPCIMRFGAGETFKNVDDFLARQIYGGMVFGLRKIEELETSDTQVLLPHTWYEAEFASSGGSTHGS